VNLAGYCFTDNVSDLNQWTFPNVTLPAGGYLVVFASGNGVPDSLGHLHTNFRLSASGEFFALIRPDGSVSDEFAPQFPKQLPGRARPLYVIF
jgi:hypothetical protein